MVEAADDRELPWARREPKTAIARGKGTSIDPHQVYKGKKSY
jgi:hypothetical protein